MLRDEYHVLHARSGKSAHPLLRIELRGIEDFRIGGAVSPLLIEERIRAKVDDGAHLQILPLDLLRGRLKVNSMLSGEASRNDHGDDREQNYNGGKAMMRTHGVSV